MAKAIGVERVAVVCDECGYSFDVNSLKIVAKYHNTPCFKCGEGNLVDDAALALLEKTISAIELIMLVCPDSDDNLNHFIKTIHIDSKEFK